jgi:LAO/AO transport system kinase
VPVSDIQNLLQCIRAGDASALARGITLVENGLEGSRELLSALTQTTSARLVGITGPPGAGKSTLVNALLGAWTDAEKRVAVIAVDPSSPFHFGSLLGDRIRMSRFYNNAHVYIRSLATRGSLGGLHPRIFEISDLVKEAGFDIVVIETVGVGQSEVEIAGLADCTVVTLVPEAGDAIQTMKAGLLEIADLFVVNKSDRPEAEKLYQSLRVLAHERAIDGKETPVIKTVATISQGIPELIEHIATQLSSAGPKQRHQHLLLEKVYRLIQNERMAGITKSSLKLALEEAKTGADFNIYSFARKVAKDGIPGNVIGI